MIFSRPAKTIFLIKHEDWTEDDQAYYENMLTSRTWQSVRKKFTNRIDDLKEQVLGELTDEERRQAIAKIEELTDFLLGFDNDAHTE